MTTSTWYLNDFSDASVTPRRGRDLWSKLRQTVKQTTLADVLNALGAIPSGFRDSTMSNLLQDSRKSYSGVEMPRLEVACAARVNSGTSTLRTHSDCLLQRGFLSLETNNISTKRLPYSLFGVSIIRGFTVAIYLTSSWIMPHPSATGVTFKDLKWHHTEDHLLPMSTKISHEVSILMARKIPLPGQGWCSLPQSLMRLILNPPGIKVMSRHIRIAVFNKNDVGNLSLSCSYLISVFSSVLPLPSDAQQYSHRESTVVTSG